MRVLAMYLPQYHEIPENNKWWGDGYTEWTAVRNAKPVYKGHIQPQIPLNENYYDLSDETGSVWNWQADLANKYGVYGFCIYHYWFEGKMLLEKPMEILRKHEEINIRYCVCWANESWTRTWYGLEKEILMAQGYGDSKDWDAHFFYLLDFFRDPRYIKINNKPLLNLYRSSDISCLKEMLERWNTLAREYGFDGLYLVVANTAGDLEARTELVDAYYNFEPGYSIGHRLSLFDEKIFALRSKCCRELNRIFGTEILEGKIKIDAVYKANIKENHCSKPVYYGSFMTWDNTPRRRHKGTVYDGASPLKFKSNLQKISDVVPEDDFVYINAWNEWGEGANLEPDSVNQYAYLEAIRDVVQNR